MQLNAGTCTRIAVAGGTAPYSAAATLGHTAITNEGASFLIRALANGRETLSISDASGSSVSIPVLVAPDAGVLPASVTVTFAGHSPPAQSFEAAAVTAELAREAHLKPNSRVVGIDAAAMPSALAAGTRWNNGIPIELQGGNQWRDVDGTVAIALAYVNVPDLVPSELFFSDDPEQVTANESGVLFREELASKTAARVFTYAQLDAPGEVLYLILRSKGSSHVQLLGDGAGPGFYDDVGHKTTLRYLVARRSQRSIIAPVSNGDPLVVAVAPPIIEAPRVVSAIYDIGVLDGDPVDVIIAALQNADDPLAVLDQTPPASFEDRHYRSGVYPLDVATPIVLSASVGMQFAAPPDGMTARVGSWAVPPMSGKRYLIGDFGIVRPLRVVLTNVTRQNANVYMYEAPSTHGTTATVLFDDMPTPVELPCLQPPGRYLIRTFTVPPGGAPLEISGTFMTDGGSEYPSVLGLSFDAPLTPPTTRICTAGST